MRGEEMIGKKSSFLCFSGNLMKYIPRRYYLVMKTTPKSTGDKTLMTIGYRYNYWQILVFISIEGCGRTVTCDTYLSYYLDKISNVIYPFFYTCILDRYFNGCNDIRRNNNKHKYEPFGRYILGNTKCIIQSCGFSYIGQRENINKYSII